MIQHMLAESCGALFVASGSTWRRYEGKSPVTSGVLSNALRIPGTLVSIRFDRGQIASYRDVLASAQRAMNLLPTTDDDMFFT